ncbi:MAG: hypothetical protein ABL949_09270 [Fimbriimonadaceae bacterium]
MKLNLLPTGVARESKGRFATVMAIVLAGAGIFSLFFQSSRSAEYVKQQQDRIDAAKAQAERAVSYVNAANDILQNNRGVILNANLAKAMEDHSDVYPKLYDDVKQYIPAWFRINSLAATPGGADATVVTMTGVIKSQEQYADIMLAMLRVPNVVNVSRRGFVYDNPAVPPLTEADQMGRSKKPSAPTIPDDPLDRLELQIASATTTGFQNVGGFGTTAKPVVRQAMPGWSNITIDLLIRTNVQSPDPISAVRSTDQMWPKVDFAAGSPAATPAANASKPNTATTPSGGGN